MVLFPDAFEVRRIVCVEKIKQTLNNELKFHIVNIYCMSGAMNRHCIPGLTMSTVLTGNFWCVSVRE